MTRNSILLSFILATGLVVVGAPGHAQQRGPGWGMMGRDSPMGPSGMMGMMGGCPMHGWPSLHVH